MKARCPACHSDRTRVRFTRWRHDVSPPVKIRHRLCLDCGKRFRMEVPPERMAGYDPAA